MSLVQKLLKFGSIGGLMFLTTILLYFVAFEIFSLPLYTVYVTVFIITVSISYLLNSKYTFVKKTSFLDYIKYLASYVFGMVLGLIALYLIKENFSSVSDFWASIIVIAPRTLLNYFIVNKFVYQ